MSRSNVTSHRSDCTTPALRYPSSSWSGERNQTSSPCSAQINQQFIVETLQMRLFPHLQQTVQCRPPMSTNSSHGPGFCYECSFRKPLPESQTGGSSDLLLGLMNGGAVCVVLRSLEVCSIPASRSDLRRDQSSSMRSRKREALAIIC